MTFGRGWIIAAAVAAAFALGTRFGTRGDARVEVHREPAAATTRIVTETRAPGAALTAEQVRAIVREEVAAAREPDAPAPDPQRVEAREQAAARAHEVVARAIEEGTWTEQDRDALRIAMNDLERAQVDEVLAELIPALNEGRMRQAYRGTPL